MQSGFATGNHYADAPVVACIDGRNLRLPLVSVTCEDLENIIQSNDDIEIVEGKIDEVTNTTIEQSFENTEKILNFNIDLYKQRIEQATKTKEELLNIMSYLNLSSADEINPIDE